MKKKVLIFPAGTEIAFEILNALKYSKFVEIYGGTSASDHAEFVYKNLIEGFPYVDEPTFLEYLNRAIDKYQIDCVYPAHDSVSVFFSDHADEIHAQVIIADAFTTNICRSKERTYQYLSEFEFVPKTYKDSDSVSNYPVFVKPTVGQGSNGARIIRSGTELQNAIAEDDSLVICEYLPGMEYTVDCFTDKDGQLLVSMVRDRERIRNGIAVRSKNVPLSDEVQRIANCINEKFAFKGAWFFQIKKNQEGAYRLLEISPRIPGTMGLSRNLGINFPLLTLFVFWGYDVSIIRNQYDIMLDRAFYSAYKINLAYEDVYLDFDDTLTLDGKVNPDVMRFVYQAVNAEKNIHLLRRHSTDLLMDLNKLHIDSGLFCEIKVISRDNEKYNYIHGENAIFIDDSFAERKKVKDKLNIPVFDVDMIESLIDWRV